MRFYSLVSCCAKSKPDQAMLVCSEGGVCSPFACFSLVSFLLVWSLVGISAGGRRSLLPFSVARGWVWALWGWGEEIGSGLSFCIKNVCRLTHTLLRPELHV